MHGENQENLKVQNYEQLEQFWDDFSLAYTNSISSCQSGLYCNMISMLQIENSKNILETAIGPAFMLPHLIHRVKKGTKITQTDLSSNFLAIAAKRIDLFLQDPYNHLYDFDIKQLPAFNGPKEYPEINVKLEKENSENLTYPDQSFDTYISSLCLQLTSDPIKMLKEAYRVLQKGGRAAFSVWGDYEKSTFFTTIAKVLKKYPNVQKSTQRSNFHLNDKQKLIKMAEDAGFTNILTFNLFNPMHFFRNEKDIDNFLSTGRCQQEASQAGEENKEKVLAEAKEEIKKILFEQKQAIGMDVMVIVMDKA
ncbi:hypothetical protein PPERSA_06240 [Pseudocohnilembus persalinus]|uniref:Methyltransferase type 11 domain-containing protein n=1 Tax=Pseudocohnilembus persalinus TaxID=266149 RepID=A0A0V0QW00_PSEPJ|nr:hypothetical protein PPERSA_06240 [Pseudocohnilembus persalinus]|eukprot:KRX06269.1 hypothetical protein PPERSA_06240 [Pseudocohnilembus persalinus]